MFGWFTNIFCPRCFPFGTGPRCEDCSPETNRYAKAMTPDQLIAAHFIQSIAKDYDDWKLTQIREHRGRYSTLCILSNKKKSLSISYKRHHAEYDYDYSDDYSVDGVNISADEGCKIVKSYFKIRDERAELKRVADEARRKMEEEKKKWDIAEKLTGLKRLPSGALVPKDYKGDCPLGGCAGSQGCACSC